MNPLIYSLGETTAYPERVLVCIHSHSPHSSHVAPQSATVEGFFPRAPGRQAHTERKSH